MANEQEIAKLIIRITAETAQMKAQLADIQSQLKQNVIGTQSMLSDLKSAWVKTSAEIMAAYLMVRKAIDWTEIGAKAMEAEETYGSVTRSMAVDGEKLIDRLKQVGYVFVDTTELMSKSSRLLMEGIKPDQIVMMMQAAVVAAKKMQIDVSDAFDQITEAVVRFNIRGGLKSIFPMDVNQVFDDFAARSGRMGKDLNDMGKRQAMLEELSKRLTDQTQKMGNAFDPDASMKIQKFKSALSGLVEMMGTALANVFSMVYDQFDESMKTLEYLWGKIPERFKATVVDALRKLWTEIYGAETANKAIDQLTKFISMMTEKGVPKTAAPGVPPPPKPEDVTGLFREKTVEEKARERLDTLKSMMEQGIDIRKAALEKGKAITEELLAVEEKAWQEGVTSEKEYNRNRAELEQASIKDQMSAVSDEINITKIGYREMLEVVGLTDDERIKLRAERDKQFLALETQYFVLEQQMQKSSIDASIKATDLEYRMRLQNGENLLKLMQEQADREKEINAEKISMGIIRPGYAAIQEMDNQIKINNATVLNLQLQRDLAKNDAEKLAKEGEISRLQEQQNTLAEKRELMVRQEAKDLNDLYLNTKKSVEELRGGYVAMKDADLQLLDIERKRILVLEGIDEKTRNILLQENQLKEQSIKAERDMDAAALIGIGTKQAAIDANTVLANQYKNLLPAAIDVALNTESSLFDSAIRGTFDWRTALRGVIADFSNLVKQIGLAIAKQEILNALSKGGGGGAGAGGIAGFLGSILEGIFGGGAAAELPSAGEAGATSALIALPAQHGLSGWTRGITPFLAGEGGESEFVSITPKSAFSAQAAARGKGVNGEIRVTLDPGLVAQWKPGPDEMDQTIAVKVRQKGATYRALKETR
jgi:hypothetical protein